MDVNNRENETEQNRANEENEQLVDIDPVVGHLHNNNNDNNNNNDDNNNNDAFPFHNNNNEANRVDANCERDLEVIRINNAARTIQAAWRHRHRPQSNQDNFVLDGGDIFNSDGAVAASVTDEATSATQVDEPIRAEDLQVTLQDRESKIRAKEMLLAESNGTTSYESDPPPTYQEAMSRLSIASSNSSSTLPPTQDQVLQVKDFHPEFIDGVWDTFDLLMIKANSWLQCQQSLTLVHCESAIQFAAHIHGYNSDRSINTKTKNHLETTVYIRYLRLWYVSNAPGSQRNPLKLRFLNFFNEHKKATIGQLMEQLNQQAKAGMIGGSILNIETLYCLRHVLTKPNNNAWMERPQDNKSYSFFLRVFILETPDEVPCSVGFIDFVPKQTRQYSYPYSFDGFTTLVENCRKWMLAQKQVQALNMQSLYTKVKAVSDCDYWQRVHFTEANFRAFMPTNYLQILRLYYERPLVPGMLRRNLSITCKTFMPAQLTSALGNDLSFESQSECLRRVQVFLEKSGAKVLNIQTVPLRMFCQNRGILSSECSHVWCWSDGQPFGLYEHWIVGIRVFILGDFTEVGAIDLPTIPNVEPYHSLPPPKNIIIAAAKKRFPPAPKAKR